MYCMTRYGLSVLHLPRIKTDTTRDGRSWHKLNFLIKLFLIHSS